MGTARALGMTTLQLTANAIIPTWASNAKMSLAPPTVQTTVSAQILSAIVNLVTPAICVNLKRAQTSAPATACVI
jgi:hypothetical protein